MSPPGSQHVLASGVGTNALDTDVFSLVSSESGATGVSQACTFMAQQRMDFKAEPAGGAGAAGVDTFAEEPVVTAEETVVEVAEISKGLSTTSQDATQ